MSYTDVLKNLKDDIKSNEKFHIDYTIEDKKMVDNCLMGVLTKDSIYVDYETYLEDNRLLTLDNLVLINDYIDCHVCGAYTLKEDVTKDIVGYIDSIIVILKVGTSTYKIDVIIEKLDKESNKVYETSILGIITL